MATGSDPASMFLLCLTSSLDSLQWRTRMCKDKQNKPFLPQLDFDLVVSHRSSNHNYNWFRKIRIVGSTQSFLNSSAISSWFIIWNQELFPSCQVGLKFNGTSCWLVLRCKCHYCTLAYILRHCSLSCSIGCSFLFRIAVSFLTPLVFA